MAPSFSGHETFPLRFSWLAKAVEAADENPEIFSDDVAIATFGVGRNMVRAIKHWGLATGVLEPVSRSAVAPTSFGLGVFGPDGHDPYCEDPATLWLLHWHLCRDAGRAALWHYAFGLWRGHALDLRALQPAIASWLGTMDAKVPSKSTLKRDLLCLAATYATPSARQDPEDAASCPLTSLGLLYDDAGTLYLREGRQRGLTPEVFAYAVLDFWERARPEARDALRSGGPPRPRGPRPGVPPERRTGLRPRRPHRDSRATHRSGMTARLACSSSTVSATSPPIPSLPAPTTSPPPPPELPAPYARFDPRPVPP